MLHVKRYHHGRSKCMLVHLMKYNIICNFLLAVLPKSKCNSHGNSDFSLIIHPFSLHLFVETKGRRLGSAADSGNYTSGSRGATQKPYEDYPKPVVNKNLTDSDRDQIRAERAAAAEARAKKNQIGGTGKKKNNSSSEPLRGPNSRNTMTWNL